MPRTDHPALRVPAGSLSLPGIPTDRIGISGDARQEHLASRVRHPPGDSPALAARGSAGPRLRRQVGGGAAEASLPVGARQAGRLLVDPGTSLSTCFLKLRFKLLLRRTLGIPGTWKQKAGTAGPANNLVARL